MKFNYYLLLIITNVLIPWIFGKRYSKLLLENIEFMITGK